MQSQATARLPEPDDPRLGYVSAQVTRRVKQNTDIPVLVKLSPNVTSVAKVAEAVAEAGADGITAINSLGPGLILDVETRRPVLAHGAGGVSGPAIRLIAVRWYPLNKLGGYGSRNLFRCCGNEF